jgi:hypothetical protein
MRRLIILTILSLALVAIPAPKVKAVNCVGEKGALASAAIVQEVYCALGPSQGCTDATQAYVGALTSYTVCIAEMRAIAAALEGNQ